MPDPSQRKRGDEQPTVSQPDPGAPLIAAEGGKVRLECAAGHVSWVHGRFSGRRVRCPVCQQPAQVPPSAGAQVSTTQTLSGMSGTLEWSPPGNDPYATQLSTASANPVSQPQKFGRFEIVRVLGEGAFGTVYLAYDRPLKREVALKVKRGNRGATSSENEDFLREARAAAHLRHANIVPVYEAGLLESGPYIAMGYVQGTTLKTRLEQGWQPEFGEAVRIVRKLAGALHASHLSGVIHRDVKPANVLLDPRNEPYLSDFGLARREHTEALQTMAGTVLGTPAYMSPEQANGQAHVADARTDQWSVGVMLYELLTGQRPFTGSISEILKSIDGSDPPRLRTLNPAVPRDLETIVLVCLAKQPERRYPSCQHLIEELQRWERCEPILARQTGQLERAAKWLRRNPALAIVSAILLSTSLIFLCSLLLANARLQRQQAELSRAVRTANENAARWQASENKLTTALDELGITSADKIKAVKELQAAAQNSSAIAYQFQQLQVERDKLAEELAKIPPSPKDRTREELVEKLMATGSESAYRFGIAQAEAYLLGGSLEEARHLLNSAPTAHRDWEWYYLSARVNRREHAVVTLPWFLNVSGPCLSPQGIASLTHGPQREQPFQYYRLDPSKSFPTFELQTVATAQQAYAVRKFFTDDGSHFIIVNDSKWTVIELNKNLAVKELNPRDPQGRLLYLFTNRSGELITIRFKDGKLLFSAMEGEQVIASYNLPPNFDGRRGSIPSEFIVNFIVVDADDEGYVLLQQKNAYRNECPYWALAPDGARNYHPWPLQPSPLGRTDLHTVGIHGRWAYGIDNSRLHIWNARTGTEEVNLALHTEWLGAAGCPLITPSGKRVLIGNALRDVESGVDMIRFPARGGFVGFAPGTGYLFERVVKEVEGKQEIAIEVIIPESSPPATAGSDTSAPAE